MEVEGTLTQEATVAFIDHWPLVIGLALGLFVAQRTIFHPLRSVPGPFFAKFTYLWLTIRYTRGGWFEDVIALHEKYGPVVRIAPNQVSFVDQHALKELYGHGKPSEKTHWYDTWVIPGMADSFFATTNAKIHRQVRSRVSGTYSMSAILAMEDLIAQVMSKNVAKLHEISRRGKPIRIDEWANFFTFDVVGQLSMGGPIGFLEQEQDVGGIIQSINDGFFMMGSVGYIPLQTFWINNPVSSYLLRAFGGKRMGTFETFMNWLDERVTARMRDGLPDGRRPDMLQYFIEGKTPDDRPVSKAEVMVEGVNILGAGADTTAIAILAVLGALLTKPGAYARLQKEVDQAYIDAGIQPGDDEELTFHQLETIPYLAAVVRESTRLHPSITFQLPRHPPPQGVQIGEHHIPRSVVCGFSAAAMNRDRSLFGKDAAEWVPERWIPHDESEEEIKRIRFMEQNLTTFGMGSRSCIGRNLAYVEVHKYVSAFVHHFDAELVNPEKPWVVFTQWFSFPRKFWIHLKEREL